MLISCCLSWNVRAMSWNYPDWNPMCEVKGILLQIKYCNMPDIGVGTGGSRGRRPPIFGEGGGNMVLPPPNIWHHLGKIVPKVLFKIWQLPGALPPGPPWKYKIMYLFTYWRRLAAAHGVSRPPPILPIFLRLCARTGGLPYLKRSSPQPFLLYTLLAVCILSMFAFYTRLSWSRNVIFSQMRPAPLWLDTLLNAIDPGIYFCANTISLDYNKSYWCCKEWMLHSISA